MCVSRARDTVKTAGKGVLRDSHLVENGRPNCYLQKSKLFHRDAVWEDVNYPFISHSKQNKKVDHKTCIES